MKNKEKSESFQSVKREYSRTIKVSAPSSEVFPLLCPTKEYDWIEDWKCDLLYSNSGFAEYLCVFKTNGSPYGQETWICTRYEPNKAIQYTRFSADTISVLDITLTEDNTSNSTWLWILSVLSINENGTKLMESVNQEYHIGILKNIEVMLEYYFKTGQMLIR